VKKPIILIGSAPCLYDDMEGVPGFWDWPPIDYDFMAIGFSAIERDPQLVPMVSCVAALDIGEDMPRIKQAMGHRKYKIISWVNVDGVDIIVPLTQPPNPPPAGWSGSSALLGALGALQIGYKKIILCGCPLIGKHPRTPGVKYEIYHEGWRRHEEAVRDKVKSMSGWTREFLGKPTEAWING
jgi:hypothetical protein